MVHKVPGHSTLLCNLKQDRQQIEKEVKRICRESVPGWDKIRHVEDITVRLKALISRPTYTLYLSAID